MECQQTFMRGKPVSELASQEIFGEQKSRQGTRVRFWPDKEVFTTTTKFDYNTIAGRIRELAFLNPELERDKADLQKWIGEYSLSLFTIGSSQALGSAKMSPNLHMAFGSYLAPKQMRQNDFSACAKVAFIDRICGLIDGGCRLVKITLKQENDNAEKVSYNEYYYAGGLVEYVRWLNHEKKPIHEPIAFKREKDGINVDIALQWCSDAYADTLLGYANSIRTSDGGSHMDGVKSSLTRTLNNLGRKSKIIKEKDENLSGEHVREGLTCIVAVKVSNPEFEGQTKTRLGNPEVRRVVEQAVQEYLTEYLECNPEVLESILSKALNAFKSHFKEFMYLKVVKVCP
eukprot:Gb_27264 [translate_table: standard]